MLVLGDTCPWLACEHGRNGILLALASAGRMAKGNHWPAIVAVREELL